MEKSLEAKVDKVFETARNPPKTATQAPRRLWLAVGIPYGHEYNGGREESLPSNSREETDIYTSD